MVKTPRTRHSKSGREPMTIELGPGEVSRSGTVDQTSSEAAAEASADHATEALPDAGVDAVAKEEVVAAASSMPEEGPAGKSGAGDAPSGTGSEFGRGEAAEPPSATTAPPPRSSRGGAAGAGLVGGVVALAAAGLLQYAGVLGTPGATNSGEASVPAAVESELAALKSEIETLKAEAPAPVDISGVSSQVEGLSQALDQVKSEISTLQQSVQNGGAGDGAAVEALNSKIAEIESRIAGIDPSAGAASADEISTINEKIASVQALADAARDADQEFATRLGSLEQSVSTLSTKVEAQAGQPKIALAIASAALKSAIERGAPFLSEIETFAAIAPQAPGLAELRAYAQKGVATRADLVGQTDGAAKAMIAAANPPPANAGFFDRLLSSAESLVSVRPIGAVEGSGVPETVARMEVALQAGDLAGAIAEYDSLPEAAKAAGATFADDIRSRLEVEKLADQAIAAAMQA